LKILILYETVYPDFIGGVEHRNHELAAALARRGNEVTLAGFCKPLPGIPPRLRVQSLGELGKLYNREGKRSTRKALRFAAAVPRVDLSEYDVVETANMPYVHVFPLALRCALAGKPLLVTWYEYWGPYWKEYLGPWKAPAYRLVEWLTAQLGTAVAATSRLTLERLAARRWRGRVEALPCGIDLARVRAAAARDVGGEVPPLVYAGRLLREKRLDLLLGAVKLLAESRSGVLLAIFGEGPHREALERLAADLGIAGRVAFRGHVERSEDVWAHLGRARLAVQPSSREGFGLFPLEAMAAGLPVVYCDSPESAVPELVRHGVEGEACPPDPAALAAALDRLLSDEPGRARLAAAARERAARYDWDEIARGVEELCASLRPSARRPGASPRTPGSSPPGR
jgi:L-malate glycosyltransferase